MLLEFVNKAVLYTRRLRQLRNPLYDIADFARMHKKRTGDYTVLLNDDEYISCVNKENCLRADDLRHITIHWLTMGRDGPIYGFFYKGKPIAIFSDDPALAAMVDGKFGRYFKFLLDQLHKHFVEANGDPVKMITVLPNIHEVKPIKKRRVLDPSVRLKWSEESRVREYNRNEMPSAVSMEGVNEPAVTRAAVYNYPVIEPKVPGRLKWSETSRVREYNRNESPITVSATGVNAYVNTKMGGKRRKTRRVAQRMRRDRTLRK